MGHSIRDKGTIALVQMLRVVPRLTGANSKTYSGFLQFSQRLLKGVTVLVDNLRFHLIDLESLAILSPNFEPFMNLWFTPRNHYIVLDIGAHIGKYTISAAKAVGPEGTVIAVEAYEPNYRVLQANIALNDLQNVIPLNVAAWNQDTEVKLYKSRRSGWHTTAREMQHGFDLVKARRMDNILSEIRVNRVDLVKIDVEGAECEVIEGMGRLLESKPRILIELSTRNLERLKSFLKTVDYAAVQVSGHTESVELGDSIAYYFLC
jgi:FkbM family methyltransferase